MRHRVILALIIAPLIAPLAGLLLYTAHSGKFPPIYTVRTIFNYYGLIAYTVTALVGVPAYLLLRSSILNGKLTALLLGGVCGVAVGMILFSLVPGGFIRDNREGYAVFALTGAACGVVFWMIASVRQTDKRRATISSNREI